MPDSQQHDSSPHDASPRGDWTEAFAALPLETPNVSAWPALAARLDARHRVRWPLWLATAAALALVVVVPLRRLADDTAPARSGDVAADAGSTVRPAIRPAGTPATQDSSPGTFAAEPATSGDQSRSAFERLYAESAQLEAVLEMARDDRVASGPAAALSGELDAYVATIDAALSQSALPQAQRLALWDRRVDALRQVAGFESTQRWLAANGERYDGALVSVD